MSRDRIEDELKKLPEPKPDPDNREWTKQDFAEARPPQEVLPPGVLAQFPKTRGRPKSAEPKEHVSLRLSPKVLAHFRAKGPGWQSAINEVLLKAAQDDEPASPRAAKRR